MGDLRGFINACSAGADGGGVCGRIEGGLSSLIRRMTAGQEASAGLLYLHEQTPPIVHRDVSVCVRVCTCACIFPGTVMKQASTLPRVSMLSVRVPRADQTRELPRRVWRGNQDMRPGLSAGHASDSCQHRAYGGVLHLHRPRYAVHPCLRRRFAAHASTRNGPILPSSTASPPLKCSAPPPKQHFAPRTNRAELLCTCCACACLPHILSSRVLRRGPPRATF